MRKILKIYFIFLFCFFGVSMGGAFAADYFVDEFNDNSIDGSKWEVVANSGIANEDFGYLALSAESTSTFPFVYSKINPIPLTGNFNIEFKIQYTRVRTKGTGLVFATQLPTNGSPDTPLSSPLFSNHFFIDVWQDIGLGFFNVYSGSCYNSPCNFDDIFAYRKAPPDPTLPDLDWHIIKFSYLNGIYKVFIDGIERFTSTPTLIRPTKLWLGNYTIQGPGDTWTNFRVDYIRITSESTPLSPVVILPGLGASWNPAVLTGGEAPQSEWKIPWFVKHYEGLSDTLVNAGYTKGQNLFMFAYDWRKPIDQTADVLKNYLENVVEPLNPGLKTDLVGHSLGGLVARAYSQKYGISNVDKVVSVGSPHSGAIQSYLAWSGGEIKPDKLWQYFAFELLLQANKTGFQTDADVFRAKVPSIHDIMPTFNYLKKNTSPYPIIPLSSMNSFNKNFWLEDLNESVNSSFFDVFTAIEGNKGNTPEWYRVIKPNWWEKILDLWQDGKPTKTEFGVGDLAVLAKSGRINPDPFEQIDNANHTELITTEQGIQRIMDILGLTPSSIVTYPEFDFTPAILFASPSKIKLHITSPNGTFDSDIEKFVLLSNAPSGDYSVELIGDSDEIYSLFVGQETNSETYWNNYVGNLSGTGSEIYRFSFDTNNPNPNPLSDLTGVENLKAARSKLNTLPNLASKKKAIDQLDKIISLVVQGKKIQAIASFNLLIEKVFTYRKGATLIMERNISFEALMDIQRSYVILTNLVKIPGLKEQAKVLIKAADSVYKATNKTLEELSRFNKISKTATASFANAENILNEAKLSLDKKDFNRSIILSQISIFLTKETLGK